GVVPESVIELDNVEAAKKMVIEGLAWRCCRAWPSRPSSAPARSVLSVSWARRRCGVRSWQLGERTRARRWDRSPIFFRCSADDRPELGEVRALAASERRADGPR